MDQAKFLNVVRRYALFLVLAALVASLTAFLVLNDQPTLYEAKTRLLVGPTVDSPNPDLNSLRIGGQLMTTYADLVTTRPFLESISNKLGQKINLEELGAMIETKQNAEARILTIYVRHQDPKQAVAIANAAAETLVEISPSQDNSSALLRAQLSNQSQQLEQMITNTEASIQQLEVDLIALGNVQAESPEAAQMNLERQKLVSDQLAGERSRMSDTLRTLATLYQVLLQTNTNQLEIIEPAGAVFPLTQNLPLRIAASGLAGLLLVMSIIFAYEYFDDTIRLPGDFTRSVKVPLLSTIDSHNHLGDSGLKQVVTFVEPNSQAANDYRTAVAKLLFSIGNSMPYTLLLSTAGSQAGDDIAITVANLGVAFAQAGHRVILVDAQLQKPALTEVFEAKSKVGLSDILAPKSSELKLLSLKEMPGLQLLPVGLSSEKWPGAMLNAANIGKLVKELQKEADIILVAGPPISGFAESLALASQVNGVILVGRYGEAHSQRINEVAESLNAMNVQLAGVVIEHSPSPFAAKRNLRNSSPAAGVASRVSNSEMEHKATGPAEKSNVP
jgi:capsular polysaccharide biosynthesis protein/Mrp family chromosome partitioning ATPase